MAFVLILLHLVSTFSAEHARQGVAVDADHFYAIDSRAIGKYEKPTGKLLGQWKAGDDGTIIHLDSGVVVDGKLYCAHSNYPAWPMRSSVEIWDTQSMVHTGSHDFGVKWGSLTWLDHHNGYWWATFANYDQLIGPNQTRYGGKENTILLKLDKDWQELASWRFPADLLARFGEMSNSGGSWGPDGRLYLTGHDAAEIYAVKVPDNGRMIESIETIAAPIAGQGIAWDRTGSRNLYGIDRARRQVIVCKFF